MPLIRIQHPANAFLPDQRDALAERMTNILLMIEGGHDTAEARTMAYVVFTPTENDNFYVGGRTDGTHMVGAQKLVIEVTVPEAATTQPLKTEIHRQIHAALAQVLGWRNESDGMNAWVLVHEVPEGHWGANGETFGLARISQYAKVPPDPQRGKFVQAYFKAKAKLRALVEFPDEASGLMRRPPKA